MGRIVNERGVRDRLHALVREERWDEQDSQDKKHQGNGDHASARLGRDGLLESWHVLIRAGFFVFWSTHT